jgi:DIS3-like exonuclease 2
LTPASSIRNNVQGYFAHMEEDEALACIAAGAIFRAVLRCNAADRSQGFCSIPGLPSDLFINGLPSQNRAMEGDEVAVRVLPPEQWWQRGSERWGQRSDRRKSNAGRRGGAVTKPTPIATFAASAAVEDAEEEAEEAASRVDLVSAPALMPSPSFGEAAFSFPSFPSRQDFAGLEEAAAGMAGLRVGSIEGEGEPGENGNKVEGGSLPSTPAGGPTAWYLPQSGGTPATAAADAVKSPTAASVAMIASLMEEMPDWRPTAEVVAILKPSRRRQTVVGVFRAGFSHNNLFLLPIDPRLPTMAVSLHSLPTKLKRQLLAEAAKAKTSNGAAMPRLLASASVVGWEASHSMPEASVTGILGTAGALQVEVGALLMAEGVEDDDLFTPEVLACLPQLPWTAQSDPGGLEGRRDFRDTRVFSIDPPTARDLDDALSIQCLSPEESAAAKGAAFRVGVHIADVAYFVRPGTALDEEAAKRGTSVYLVDRVVPMLPRTLCEELCSLNPGVERMTFSIVWDLTQEGEVL